MHTRKLVICEVPKVFAQAEEGTNNWFAIRLVKWNGGPVKLDIRSLFKDRETGELRNGRGKSLSLQQAKLLQEHLPEAIRLMEQAEEANV